MSGRLLVGIASVTVLWLCVGVLVVAVTDRVSAEFAALDDGARALLVLLWPVPAVVNLLGMCWGILTVLARVCLGALTVLGRASRLGHAPPAPVSDGEGVGGEPVD